MKHLLQRARSLAILGSLLVLTSGWGRAQTPVAQQLDVFFGETKLLPIDRPIDSFTVSPDNIVKVDKSEGAPNQLSIVGMAGGNATLTVKSDGRTLLYAISVSPAPERLYINLNESKRLSFPNPIDDYSVSQGGVVRVVQPDSTDKVLLLEASAAGKTTLTVYSNKEIYRYFVSTFDNRGADILEIQNAFSAKGYRNLTIGFDKDQAVIGGSVPTQEELDDAVRIVKQYTDFVVVRASLGELGEPGDQYSEQEQIIINNIQRIANVKGLIVRVKYPQPQVVMTSTYTTSAGDYVAPTTTTTPQGGVVRGGGFLPPSNEPPAQGPNVPGPTELRPQANTTRTVTTTENTSIPEKIFLYGDMQDDLDEAKVLRVARTFCPFVVNFMTVKDPIQIRTAIRFMQVTSTNTSSTGFYWSGGGPNGGPSFTLGFGPNTVLNQFIFGGGMPSTVSSLLTGINYGVTGLVNASATLELLQNLGLSKELREADLFLTNGQPGWYSEGEIRSYISGTTTVVGTASTNTTPTTSSVFLGLNMDIAPLNVAAAGGTESPGQQILGIAGNASTSSVAASPGPGVTPDMIGRVGTIQQGGAAPVIDNTTKYVDENGMIGMNVSTQLTLPGNFQTTTISGVTITLPDFFVRTTKTRLNLRDGQTVTIDGLIDQEMTKAITQVPFLSSIPLFGALFKSHSDTNVNEEVVILVTPHLVRMRDPDSARYPKPFYPEMQRLASEYGDVPQIKPVRYDAQAVDLRPESPKDVKSSTAPTTPPPLTPHASGGMQTLQPPAATPAVDNSPRGPDISKQPSTAPLAPSSTLP